MDYYRAFPFYSGYQGYGQWRQTPEVSEDRIIEDLEYLQQMYPSYAKKYQSVIGSVVDKMDYDGSFIYDQYPDKLTMQRMVSSIMTIIKSNEEGENNEATNETPSERVPWQEKEPWIRELVTLVMYYEILARRRKRKKYFYT